MLLSRRFRGEPMVGCAAAPTRAAWVASARPSVVRLCRPVVDMTGRVHGERAMWSRTLCIRAFTTPFVRESASADFGAPGRDLGPFPSHRNGTPSLSTTMTSSGASRACATWVERR